MHLYKTTCIKLQKKAVLSIDCVLRLKYKILFPNETLQCDTKFAKQFIQLTCKTLKQKKNIFKNKFTTIIFV